MTRTLLLSSLLLLGASCGEAPLLELKVVTPEGADPLATADRVRLTITEPAAVTTGAVAGGKFGVELKVEVAGAVGSIVLEALAVDRLVARGETPPLSLRPEALELALLVGRAGELGTLPARLPSPGWGLTSVLLPSLGLVLAGGGDAADRPLASAVLYDFFQHQVATLAPMPEPRLEAVGAICGSGCMVVALGAGAQALADKLLRYRDQAWSMLPDRLAPSERRRGAGLALLSDGTCLVVGGEGAAGPLDTALRLRPGDSLADPSLEVLPARARAPRRRPAVGGIRSAVLIVGGQPEGATPAELFYAASGTFQALSLEAPVPISGSAVCDLADGKLAVVGGRDETGGLIKDGWIVDPVTTKVTHVPGCLAEGRADHQLARAGKQLVVLGGVTASGPATVAEVLGPDLARVSQGAQAAPRTDFVIGRLGPESFLVAGGRSAPGTPPLPLLEVFETSVLR